MKPILFVAVLALIVASMAPTTTAGESPATTVPGELTTEVHSGAYVLAASDARMLSGSTRIVADSIDVRGVLMAPPAVQDGATIELVAESRITISGAILGADGASHDATTALVAPDGGDGSFIILRAPEIHIMPGASIVPGHGGKGGAAIPAEATGAVVRGGNGGNGGYIVLDGGIAALPPMEGPDSAFLGNAMGGDGGAATATGAAEVYGGNGGRYGTIITTDLSVVPDLKDRAHIMVADATASLQQESASPNINPLEGVVDGTVNYDLGPADECDDCPTGDLLKPITPCARIPNGCSVPPMPVECTPPTACLPVDCTTPQECLPVECSPVQACVPVDCPTVTECAPVDPLENVPTCEPLDECLPIGPIDPTEVPDCDSLNCPTVTLPVCWLLETRGSSEVECVADRAATLIQGGGPCTGSDGGDVDNSGENYDGPAASSGDPGGTTAGLIGASGDPGKDGTTPGRDGGLAQGGNGEDGCWGGNGGDGGDAESNGGSGQTGGDGGTGGPGTFAGGNGGVGGRAANSGDGGTAKGGRPGCGGFAGRDGAPGTATALGGHTPGGKGGDGGNGLQPGFDGPDGPSTEGTPGSMTTNPSCVT